jgi:hypothetical protein
MFVTRWVSFSKRKIPNAALNPFSFEQITVLSCAHISIGFYTYNVISNNRKNHSLGTLWSTKISVKATDYSLQGVMSKHRPFINLLNYVKAILGWLEVKGSKVGEYNIHTS